MRFIIFGLGREGKSSYHFLRQIFDDVEIILTDDRDLDLLSRDWKSILAQDPLSSFATTKHLPISALTEAILVVAPGIAPHHQLLKQASSMIPITTNTQLFFETVLPDRAKHSLIKAHLPKLKKQPLVIGVTGTKGKSTTAHAIHHILDTAGFPCLLGGNIGLPPLDLIESIREQSDQSQNQQIAVVLELSSHQLSRLNISPQIAVIQAITPEHLDYYTDFDSYAAAKSQITAFQQPEDTIIYYLDNQQSRKVAAASKGEQIPFGLNSSTMLAKPDSISSRSLDTQIEDESSSGLRPVCSLANQQIIYQGQPVISLNQLQIKGEHNSLNLMPAIIIAHLLHISSGQISAALSSLKPLPHRLEQVANIDGVIYINDSLSTTPEATIAAIQSFPDQPIILIAGGFDRGLNFQNLAKVIRQSSVKTVLLLPDTGQKIKALIETQLDRSARSVTPPKVVLFDSLKDAVTQAKQLAEPGDVVLLSPASASFNQFRDYAQRGETFKKLVKNHYPQKFLT